ncbi:MAG TPA: hypothetical protein VLB27_08650 [candidate division Zixibacteria bacterium]|nr:hypothetical protein [candidate division Zixibacteria bacterium]
MSKPECRILRSNGEFWGLDLVASATITPDIVVASKPLDPGSAGGGTVVIDSVIQTGRGLAINGIVAAYPIAGAGTLLAFNREQRTTEFLESIVGELVTVILPRRPAYENCLLSGYPENLDGKLATAFSLTFRQNKIATSSTIVLPRVAARAKEIAPPDDIGEQSTTTVSEPRQVEDVSFAVQGLKKIGILK